MPSVSWEDIDEILHEIKGTLTKIAKIELICKDIRVEVKKELEKLNEIILRQANGDK